MKKILVILSFVLVSYSVYGLTNSTLIDFNLTGDVASLQQAQTADDSTNDLVTLEDNLFNDNWLVLLNESARLIENVRYSYATNVDSKGNDGAWEAGKVLGVRAYFPKQAWNSYSLVRPRFELELYGGDDGNKYTGGKGVIHNVGPIKSVKSWVYGRNFLVSYFVNIRNQDSVLTQIPMGNLYFSGWRQVVWNNSSYNSDVYTGEYKKTPLYPRMVPSIKLDSLQFYRGKEAIGSDFVTYVRDVTVEHDLVVLDIEEDIDDEATWNIIKTENDRKQAIENIRIREELELADLQSKRSGETENEALTGVAEEVDGNEAELDN